MPKVGGISVESYHGGDMKALVISVFYFDFYFSYQTCVAFRSPKDGLVVSENVWGKTTGRHLMAIDRGIVPRVPNLRFEEMLNDVLRVVGQLLEPPTLP